MIRIASLIIMLFVNSCLDIKYKKISVLLCVLFLIEAVFLNIQSKENGWFYIIGFLIGLFIVCVSRVTKGEIGTGDGYIICVMGTFLGVHSLLQVLMGAFLLAALVGMGLLVMHKMKRGMTLPFVPFLLLSVLLQIKSI